ncbi:MAG: HNH endonuclease [Planctomycetales bacterium]|nr:HNH endonuclease [Planctomycetales bacterium]
MSAPGEPAESEECVQLSPADVDCHSYESMGASGETIQLLPEMPKSHNSLSDVQAEGSIEPKSASKVARRNRRSETTPHSSWTYSVEIEVCIEPSLFLASDAKQFRECNRQLLTVLESNSYLANELEERFPGTRKFIEPGPRGGITDRPPPRLTWHHEPERPGVLQLIPRVQHQSKGSVQKNLHPNGRGGKCNWGGGRRFKKGRNKR